MDTDESMGLSSIEFWMGIRKLVRDRIDMAVLSFSSIIISTFADFLLVQFEIGLFLTISGFLSANQDFSPKIHISEEDFDVITNNGSLLNEQGQVFSSAWLCPPTFNFVVSQ